jgi:hypothetical protein
MQSRELHSEIIVARLSEAVAPLTVSQVCKVSQCSNPADADQVEAGLQEMVRRGRVFEHPPRQRNQGKRYWIISPVDLVKSKILKLLLVKARPLTVSQLKELVWKCEKPFFDEAVGGLLNEKKAYLFTAKRKKYLSDRMPRPSEYLTPEHLAALKEIVKIIRAHRKHTLTFAKLLRFIDGSETGVEGPATPVQPSDELFMQWYEADLPILRGGKSVPIPWTWARYEAWCSTNGCAPQVSDFKDRLLKMFRKGLIDLVPHSRTEPISDHDMQGVIVNERGEILYFWKRR